MWQFRAASQAGAVRQFVRGVAGWQADGAWVRGSTGIANDFMSSAVLVRGAELIVGAIAFLLLFLVLRKFAFPMFEKTFAEQKYCIKICGSLHAISSKIQTLKLYLNRVFNRYEGKFIILPLKRMREIMPGMMMMNMGNSFR